MITIVKAGSLPGLPIGKLHKATDADVAIEAEPQHATKMLGKIFMLYQLHYASCIYPWVFTSNLTEIYWRVNIINNCEFYQIYFTLGSAELVLPEHGCLISDCLKQPRGARELKITCADGHVSTCVLALASVSPFLRQLFLESLRYCPGDWVSNWLNVCLFIKQMNTFPWGSPQKKLDIL